MSPFYFDPVSSYSGRGAGGTTDSLLDSLGILGSPDQPGGASVKTELVSCPSPPAQYTLVDPRGELVYHTERFLQVRIEHSMSN